MESRNHLSLKNNSFYSEIGVADIRIRDAGTYDNQFVDVYIERTGTYNITVTKTHFATNGWGLDSTPDINPTTTGFQLTAINDLQDLLSAEATNSLVRHRQYRNGDAVHSGSLTAGGNVTAYSDERLKENIQTLDGKKALQMRGVSFTKDGQEGSGVIAQEVEKIAPELVITADDDMGTKSVAYGNLVGYLIETVKDQQKEIEYMKSEIKHLQENNNGNN